LPTGILLKTLVDSNIPVIAPNGDSSNDKPKLPSVNCSRCFMPGIAATQVPNNKLDVANKKLTAKAGLFFTKDDKFLIIEIDRLSIEGYTGFKQIYGLGICGKKN